MQKIFKIFTKADYILILSLILISILLYMNFNKQSSNKEVEIYYKNSLVGKYPISKDKIITLAKDIKIEIKNNKVRMLENTCKRQLCVKQGWSDSLPIICVPNKVMIKIVSSSEKKLIISY